MYLDSRAAQDISPKTVRFEQTVLSLLVRALVLS
jgi:hypothetical protein